MIHDYSSSEKYQMKYTYVGMKSLENHCSIVFDGFNEQGLTAATFYFVGYASYANLQTTTSAVKVDPYMVVGLYLVNYASVKQHSNKA